MEKFIEIHDEVLDPKLVDLIENLTLKNEDLPFIYSENITYLQDHPLHHFKPGIAHLLNQNNYNSSFSKIFNNILYGFCFFKKVIIKEIYQGRIFIDLPTPNPKTDMPPHIDSPIPHWVCLYYINDSDGDTVFFKDDMKTEIKRVSPKKGRIAFFDGSIYHAGTPSETKSRAVVNFNFTPYL